MSLGRFRFGERFGRATVPAAVARASRPRCEGYRPRTAGETLVLLFCRTAVYNIVNWTEEIQRCSKFGLFLVKAKSIGAGFLALLLCCCRRSPRT